MALGTMSYSEAKERADKLGAISNRMDEQFTRLRNQMNSLENVLKSKGATQLYETYTQLDAKLSGFTSKVTSFQQFLYKAVEEYQTQDDILTRNSQ
jgi:uncharacterized protein YukE